MNFGHDPMATISFRQPDIEISSAMFETIKTGGLMGLRAHCIPAAVLSQPGTCNAESCRSCSELRRSVAVKLESMIENLLL